MALSFVAASTWSFGTAAVTPGTPTGTAAGDLVLVTLISKYDDASLGAVPTGWTDVAPGVSTTGRSAGNDNGNLRIRAFWKIWESGDAMPSLNPTPNNVSGTKAATYRKASNEVFDIEGVLAADSTVGSPLLLQAGSTLGLKAGDILHCNMALNGDAPTWSTVSNATATGATMGAAVNNTADATTTSGTDMRMRSVRFAVNSGTATGNAQVSTTLGGTTTNAVGVGMLCRVRASVVTAPTETPTLTIGTVTKTSVAMTSTTVANATTYEFQRDSVTIQNTASTSFTDTGRTPATQYSYRVRGVSSGGAGPWSTVQTPTTTANVAPTAVITADPTTVPDILTAIALSGTTSSDSDGTIVSYFWEQLAGEPGTFSSTSTSTTTFTPGAGAVVNLLTANEAGIETDATGWAASDAALSVARSTTYARAGVASLTWVNSGAITAVRTVNIIPVTQGAVLNLAWSTSGPLGTVFGQCDWYNASNTYVSSTNPSYVGDRALAGAGTWKDVTGSLTVPSGTGITGVRLKLGLTNAGNAGSSFYVDEISMAVA